jgi:hypothetical protein
LASLLTELHGVRSILGSPLDNSPSAEDITEALEEVYQLVVNRTNNTGNAWQIGTLNIVTAAETTVYQIETQYDDFYKALSVVTIPETSSDPEYRLEFVEVEHIPQEWAYVTSQGGQLFSSSHSAQYIAFYRKLGEDGETVWCEIRPAPDGVEYYKITYQVGDFWQKVDDTGYGMPHKEQRFHLRRLAAATLLPKCRWSYDEGKNLIRKAEIEKTLERAIAMGAPAFESHIASLDQANVVELETYGDRYW